MLVIKRGVTISTIGALLVASWVYPDAKAQDLPEELPSGPDMLRTDLNRDGALDRIAWRRIGSDSETGAFYQVVVTSSENKVWWKSPEIMDSGDSFSFGDWHFGSALPELAGDLDGDGAVELVASTAQSDVSPAIFRIFRWTGSAFEWTKAASLTGEGRKGAAFRWTTAPEESQFWVQEWIGTSAEGGWVVKLLKLSDGSTVSSAIGVLLPKDGAFVLARWVEPPATPGEPFGPPEPVPPPGPDGEIVYQARLSARDHRNSQGEALTKVLDIVRQDRANVHRNVHVDPEDERDAAFGSVQARAIMSSLSLRVAGGAEAEEAILRGNPLVRVRLAGRRIEVQVLSP